MKMLIALCACAALCGCQLLSPVPSDTGIISLPGGKEIKFVNQKNFIVTGIKYSVSTNGTEMFEIASLSSTNDATCISASFTGASGLVTATGIQVNNGVKTGAALAVATPAPPAK